MALCKGLQAGATARLTKGLQGAYGVAVSSAPSVPTTDLIQALPYPNGGTLPTWTATVGGDATCKDAITDPGTGLLVPTSADLITFTEIGPTANKPFTLVKVYKAVPNYQCYIQNPTTTSYVASLNGSVFIQSSNGGNLGTFTGPTGGSNLYVVERFRRNTAANTFFQCTGVAEVSTGAALGTYLFPFDRIIANNNGLQCSVFIYSGDNGDLTESGKWNELAAWIAANNFGATL